MRLNIAEISKPLQFDYEKEYKRIEGTIVIADDCTQTLAVMQRFLETEIGVKSLLAQTGEEVLRHVQSNEIDLILLDIMMPETNGFDVLRTLKDDDATADIPVIIMTGVGGTDSAIACLECGAEDYLTKPFEPILLKARIYSHMEKRRLHQAELGHLSEIERKNHELGERILRLAHEIKEREAAERSLADSEVRFKSLASASFEAIIIHQGGVIIDYNAQFSTMFKVPKDQTIGINFIELVKEESRDQLLEWINMDNDQPIEATCTRYDGTEFAIEARSRDMIFADGGSSVITIRDVSNRKQTEQELIAANEKVRKATEMKDKFVSLVSHNLRSPLGSMIGMFNILNPAELDSPRNVDIIKRCKTSAKNLLSMADKLLDLGQLQSGKIVPKKHITNGYQLSASIIDQQLQNAVQKGITVTNNIPTNWYVVTDSQLLAQALGNLISNAIKFTTQGSVTLDLVRCDDNQSAITVHDNGVGIPQEMMDDLFLYESLSSRKGTDGERGMGVGLPLSMELMRALGGIICVESEKGNGSTFYLKLGHPCVRALIAEDDEDYALIVKNHFRDINAEIIHAVNGAEALDLFETYQPDIVIADCDMPIMDGFELTSRIKNNGGTSTPVMVMTANSDKEWETKAYAVGADHFFVKPVPENQFLEAIARFAPTPSPNLQNKSRR